MSTGRTVQKHTRVYVAGYDLSGYARSIGPLSTSFETNDLTVMTDAVKGALPGQAEISVGKLDGVLDPTASVGLHAVFSANTGARRVVSVPIGFRAAPAQGDPVFCGEFIQGAYTATPDGGVTVNLPFETWATDSSSLLYAKAWGWLLHAKGAETAVNTAVGIDDNGAATAAGGYLTYHLFSSDGTVTLKVQDAATNLNASFADLSGATSGSIDASVTPASALVALAPTATVRRYLRWQLVLGTATTATFALSFVRG